MYNETQKLFTAASGGTYVKQYGYGNENQLIMNSPWQLEQKKIWVRDKELTSIQ
jgi:hypothetical protein